MDSQSQKQTEELEALNHSTQQNGVVDVLGPVSEGLFRDGVGEQLEETESGEREREWSRSRAVIHSPVIVNHQIYYSYCPVANLCFVRASFPG